MFLILAVTQLAWWQIAPLYLSIGLIWGLFYLPRSITLQARAYLAWREDVTGGLPFSALIGLDFTKEHNVNQLRKLDLWHPSWQHPFEESKIHRSFILNVTCWPIRIPEKIICDYLWSTIVWVGHRLRDVWDKLIYPVLDFLWWCATEGIRQLYLAIRRVLTWLHDVLLPLWLKFKRLLSIIWHDILVPCYTWAYTYVTSIYKKIIARANREAIADIAALNNSDTKGVDQ